MRALEVPGEVYAVYVQHGRTVKDGKPRYQVDGSVTAREVEVVLPQGSYRATWRDTRSGSDVKTELVEGAGAEVRLLSPVYGEDIALVVRRVPGRL